MLLGFNCILGITWHQIYMTAPQVSTATKFTAIYSFPFVLGVFALPLFMSQT